VQHGNRHKLHPGIGFLTWLDCFTTSPCSRLLLVARQEWLERPLDHARAGTDHGLAAVGPGLNGLELGAAPHEPAAVFRLVLAVAAFTGPLKIEFSGR
jgi:hypothetical protein